MQISIVKITSYLRYAQLQYKCIYLFIDNQKLIKCTTMVLNVGTLVNLYVNEENLPYYNYTHYLLTA